jgi:hypothetical protein
MSDPQAKQSKPDPFITQFNDPKFSALGYDEQQNARASLFLSRMKGNPAWESAPDEQKIRVLKTSRTMLPPSFTDIRYEQFRQDLENPDVSKPARKFVYSQGVSMGQSGLLTRGVVNTAQAINNTLNDVEAGVGKLFGANPKPQVGYDDISLTMRAIGGDRDGVKLAQYLQQKYERVLNPNIPLIGGATPTQLLGSALGFVTDLLAMKGMGEPVEGALAGAAPLAKVAGRAAVTGTMGVVRGEVAGAVNAARPEKAPIEGAVDFAHGTAESVKSVGMLWGMWAAQDLAFGMLGQGAAEGLSRVGRTWARSLTGAGTRALPNADAFNKVVKGEFSDEAADLQRRFLFGNASPEALSQVGPVTRDYALSFQRTAEYTEKDLLNNPEAAFHFSMQRMMGGEPTPIGIAVTPDGPGTFRLRTGLGQKGVVLGEHLTFSQADMAGYRPWEKAIDEARSNHDEWLAKYAQTHSPVAKQMVGNYQLRMNSLQDAFPNYRTIRDSLTIVEGSQNRLAPEGAARQPSEGAMLTYGEVGQLQATGMKVAKVSAGLDPARMAEVAKRGSLLDTDLPTRFSAVTNGDYNAAIIYAKAAPESVWQAALLKGDEFRKAGATSAREDLAQWYLRNQGYDAIAHQGGDVTALYPREQVKAVSDMVNKSSREFTEPVPHVATGVVPGAQVDEMLAKARAAHGEDITFPGEKKSWAESVTVQDGRPTLWYNDAQGGTHAVFADRPTAYKPPAMLWSEGDKLDWLVEAATREGGTTLQKSGDVFSLNMKGQEAFHGNLDAVIDQFLVRSTTPAHLRASLEADGMGLEVTKGHYNILDMEGKSIGSGATVAEAMQDARYRPRLLDGRFGPRDIEVTADGSKFEYSPQGIRGSLSDVYKYAGHFMDVAEEEGKHTISATTEGKLAQGHDGAYSVEIPVWGIREKFSSLDEAKDYLGGKYKEYDNIQRLANERGFTFGYDPKQGYVLSGSTGTFSVHSIDDVGKLLAAKPDPAWAPGGQYDGGFRMKDSRDATKKPASTEPTQSDEGKYADRNAFMKAIVRARAKFGAAFLPESNTMSDLAREYGHREISQGMERTQESLKTVANQDLVDVSKAVSLQGNYRLNGKELRVVESIRQAKDAGLGQEGIDRVLSDNGYKEGDPKRPQMIDYAERLKSEYYTKIFERSGQNWDHFMMDYAQRKNAFKTTHPQEYAEMELQGPSGMSQLIQRMYGGRVPDDMHFAATHERVADMESVLSEENATVRAIKYAHMANQWTYAVENMKAFAKSLQGHDVPDVMRIQGQKFIDEAINGNQNDLQAIFKALGSDSSEGSHVNLLSILKTMAAAKIYGFKPHSALNVMEHNYLIGSGILGTEAVNKGFEISSKGGDALLRAQYEKGVFTGRSTYGFGDTGTAVRDLFSRTFNKVSKAASYFVSNAHILGRSAIYEGASWLFDKHVGAWFDAGKVGDFDRVMHNAKGFHLDAGAFDQVRSLIDQGDIAGARHAYAQNMTDQICFTWRPEDQGRALNSGVLSKLWGQLAVVPTHYMAAMGRMLGSGSFADRATSAATFAKNTAAFYGANRLAGLSGANLLPWHVVTLRGGPLWQTMVNLTVQPHNSSLKTVAQKALATAKAITPLYPQYVQATQVEKDMEAGNAYGAFLTLTGASVSPDFQSK